MAEIDAVGETEETSSWWDWLFGPSKTESEQKTQSAATSALESLPAEKVPESAPPLTDRVTPQEPTSPTPEELQAIREKERTEWLQKVDSQWVPIGSLPEHLRGDAEIVLLACKNIPWNKSIEFHHVDPSLLARESFALSLLQIAPSTFPQWPKHMRDTPTVMLAALQANKTFIKYIPDRLRSDLEFAQKLVSLDGNYLQYLSEDLRDTASIVLLALENTYYAYSGIPSALSLQYASERLRKDPQFALHALAIRVEALKFLSPSLQDDPEIVYAAALEGQYVTLDYASDRLRSDPSFAKAVVAISGSCFKYLAPELQDDPTLVLAVVKQHGTWSFGYASERLRSDRAFVTSLLQIGGDCLRYVSKELQNDAALALLALQTGHSVYSMYSIEYIECIGEELRKDEQFLHQALPLDGRFLQYCPEEWRDDPSIVLTAIEENSDALEYASERLRSDKEFAKKIVHLNGWCLPYLSEELRGDPTLVLAALATFSSSTPLESVSEQLQKDEVFLRQAIALNGHCLCYCPPDWQDDATIVLTAVQSPHGGGAVLKYASERLRGDKEFILQTLPFDGEDAIEYLSKELQDDPEILLPTLQQSWWGFFEASERLQNDKEFILQALALPGRGLLRYLPKALQEDPEIALAAVRQSGADALQDASRNLRNNKEWMLQAIQIDGNALEYASPILRTDRELVLAAIEEKPLALQFASLALQEELFQVALENQQRVLQKTLGRISSVVSLFQDSSISSPEELLESLFALLEMPPSMFLQRERHSLQHVLLHDKQILRSLIERDGSFLFLGSDELFHDVELLRLASIDFHKKALDFYNIFDKKYQQFLQAPPHSAQNLFEFSKAFEREQVRYIDGLLEKAFRLIQEARAETFMTTR